MQAIKKDIPAEINDLINEQQLIREISQHPDKLLSILKEAVLTINDGLKKFYQDGAPVENIVHGRAFLIDRLIIVAFNHVFSGIKQSVSLVAVGGYGRGELHPGSDIDLMLLLKDEEDEHTRIALEKYLLLLWDSRLEIGHSVRTIDECVTESENDITVATNIIESRLLTGDKDLFTQMQKMTGPDAIWDDRSFFQAKLEEQVQRSGKFNDTAYSLEPNIKESRGGLRDIQMIGWVAKRHFGSKNMQELVDNKFLRQDELNELLKGQNFLWRVRCSLHYLSGRREDRLLFDNQRQLANEFGYDDKPDEKNNYAIEQFMQQYYRTVMELERLNEMLLQLFREAILYVEESGEPTIINDAFQVKHGYVEVREDNVFIDRPSALLEIFYIMQQHPDIQGVRAETIRLIREHRYLINEEFRSSDEAKKIFMKIMSQTRGVTHELRRMNRYGILAAYIPAFESIVGRMQYDLFHVYTVDQHTLFVLRNLRRFSVPEFCHEFPLASGIFHHLKKPELLYYAGLFHDIAKGRQGDHAKLGAEDALEFCLSHHMDPNDAERVSWLVRNHLIMSITAQRKDISDPEVIKDFAETMRDLENLDHLYLLTVSDIRGTNPQQWNSWKDKLLIELYSKTAALLHKGVEHQTDRLENIQQNQTSALRALDSQGMSSHLAQKIWGDFTDEYFLHHTPNEIVWHTQHIMDLAGDSDLLIQTRINKQTDSLELFVYTASRDHIFANIVSVIGQKNLDVVNAQIVNCKNGYALETFKIIADNKTPEYLERAAIEITPSLNEKLSTPGESLPENLPENMWAMSDTHKHFDVPTLIEFESLEYSNVTRLHIDTNDRPGLLADISKTFISCNVRLLTAKISTAGEKALDYFDITDMKNGSTLTKSTQEQLRDALLKKL
jgi:[protein-PII] uridylyltransferase